MAKSLSARSAKPNCYSFAGITSSVGMLDEQLQKAIYRDTYADYPRWDIAHATK